MQQGGPQQTERGGTRARRAPRAAAAAAGEVWSPEDAVVCSWQARKSSLSDASRLYWPCPPDFRSQRPLQQKGCANLAYLCLTQILKIGQVCDTLESQSWQGFPDENPTLKEPDCASQYKQDSEDWPRPVVLPREQVAGDGPRWRGRLNPSLFMTAVAVAPPQRGRREHGEACGRDNRRHLVMTAEKRALNDLPPPAPVRGAFEAPADRLRALVIEAQLDRMAGGPVAERWAAVNRLVELGALPPIPTDPRDPMRQAAAAAVRQQGGPAGLRPFLRELKATLPHGLDPCAKSAQPTTAHGFNGLTSAGRRSVRDACSLLRERAGALVFGTVTLPDEAAETCTRDQLATFQSRWLFFARRLLTRRGLDPLVVLVAELHPNRRTLGGAPVTHWHYCAPTSPGPMQPWSVSVSDWHGVHRAAYRSAFGRDRGHNKGCRTEPARSDPGRYLSKYLAKARSDCRALIGTPWERCIPRQWWAWTGELRRKVTACRIRPPAAFLSWCVRWRLHLEALGEVTTDLVTIGEDGPAIGAWFGWRSVEALDRAIMAWMEDEMAALDARERAGPIAGDLGPDPLLSFEADEDGALLI